MPSSQRSDAYGPMLLASLEGQPVAEIVERDDGFIAASPFGTGLYMAPFRRWPPHHRAGMRYARGRVLDIGSGAGRVSLHLQERGQEVIAIDNSLGAIEACRRRGVRDARMLSIDEIDESLGLFDTIVMYGNNFGLFANARKAKRLLRRFHRLTSNRGRIVAESRDVHLTNDPVHLAYQERNLRRGRMAGQIRLRVRYRELATPWFDYLMVSQGELSELLNGTGWSMGRVFQSEDTYVAVIEKTSRARHTSRVAGSQAAFA
jgi:SAM-dependent methyltransferase